METAQRERKKGEKTTICYIQYTNDWCSILLCFASLKMLCEEISNSQHTTITTTAKNCTHKTWSWILRSSSKSIVFMHFKLIILKYHRKITNSKVNRIDKQNTHIYRAIAFEKNWFVIDLFLVNFYAVYDSCWLILSWKSLNVGWNECVIVVVYFPSVFNSIYTAVRLNMPSNFNTNNTKFINLGPKSH